MHGISIYAQVMITKTYTNNANSSEIVVKHTNNILIQGNGRIVTFVVKAEGEAW